MCNLAEQPDNSEHSKQLAKLMAQHNLHDKFNTNAFRTSRNYRYAQFSEMLNLGGSVDTDVIYTPESYLPRQAAVNLTLDLMDKSINIFEFGGDFRGLEDYIERLFGKNGYFENEGIQKVLGSLKPKNDVHQEKVEEFQRLYDEARTKN
ncbi:Apolipophorins-like 1, partial [Homarus americanus]